jgi:serine/threonine-protein kinase
MSDHDRLQELLVEWEVRCERGEDPPAAELCRSCPELVGPLAAEIAKLRAWRRAPVDAPVGTPEWQSPEAADGAPAATPDPPLPTAAFDGRRFRPTAYVASGGMGDIFTADDGEFGREVALKCIRDDRADDEAARDRFVREAEITGRLEHPGIVPIYSRGRDADGRPYYGMRFVRGQSLKDAIAEFQALPPGRARGLALRQLLTRFTAVCQAVAYAHSRGVIHRDLKPGNIMLGPYGETLVLDWGLAKVVGREGPHKTAAEETIRPSHDGDTADATRTGRALGTPAYMSPEQAHGRWDEVGPATDVFGLGAVLYCLLTGRPPYTGDHAVRDARECEFPPPREVRPDVPAALAAACLKAMARKPKDRYATAQELAADVERWLADEPLTAYREPFSAQAWRWARRRRTTVAVTAALGLAALVGASLLALQSELGRQQLKLEQVKTEKRAEEARDNERKARLFEKEGREAFQKYFVAVSEDKDLKAVGLEPLRKRLLEHAREYYAKFVAEHGQDPSLRAEFALTVFRLGFITREIGNKQDALRYLEQAQALLQELQKDHPEDREYARHLANSHRAVAMLYRDTGLWEPAEVAFNKTVVLLQRLRDIHPEVPGYARDLANSYNSLGLLYDRISRWERAEETYRKALALRQELHDKYPGETQYVADMAESHGNLGRTYLQIGQWEKAEIEGGKALPLRQKLYDDHPSVPEFAQDLAKAYGQLGLLYRRTDRLQLAEEFSLKALALYEKVHADHPAVSQYVLELAVSHNNLAVLYQQTDRWDQAEASYVKAQALRQELYDKHPSVPDFAWYLMESQHNLGILYRKTNRLDQAESAYLKAVALGQELYDKHPSVAEYTAKLAASLNGLGVHFQETGRVTKAEEVYLKALNLRQKLYDAYPGVTRYIDDLAAIHNNLGFMYEKAGKLEQAEAAYLKALPLLEKLHDDKPVTSQYAQDLANCHNCLGGLFNQSGRRELAEAAYLKALALQQELHDKHPDVPAYAQNLADGHDDLGWLYQQTNQRDKADTAHMRALALRQKLHTDHPSVLKYSVSLGDSHRAIGELRRKQGQMDDAQRYYTSAIAVLTKVQADNQRNDSARLTLCDCYRGRALTFDKIAQYAEAIKDWDQAIELEKGPKRLMLQSLRATSLFHAGEHEQALAVVNELALAKGAGDDTLYNCACICALVGPSKDDPQLREQYAARAVELLRKAVAAGYRDIEGIKKDTDLDSLRGRPEFADLLRKLADGADR